ncbi:MAG TPA: M23 family metallopeptidase [Clostridiales bacterium]|jgi:murein DD-endopeptidase MepM/ murein hydrolase activator NlpD|nr:M23 family metallopeptidase [Clostridiales bacterium]
MNQEKESGKLEKVSKKANFFLAGKGFYLVLCLCIAAIGISGYVVLFSNRSLDVPELPDLPDLGLATSVPYTFTPTEEPTMPVQQTVTNVPVGTTTAKPPVKTEPPQKIFYVRPLPGEVIRPYSGSTPVYNPTMDDWRTHTGIDLAAAVGEPVMAVAKGKVVDVYEDPFKGVVVAIEHEDGVRSIYCGLSKMPSVDVGDAVSAGMIIGSVGTTAAFETLDESHLHFEVMRNGEYIDPNEILPAKVN